MTELQKIRRFVLSGLLGLEALYLAALGALIITSGLVMRRFEGRGVYASQVIGQAAVLLVLMTLLLLAAFATLRGERGPIQGRYRSLLLMGVIVVHLLVLLIALVRVLRGPNYESLDLVFQAIVIIAAIGISLISWQEYHAARG